MSRRPPPVPAVERAKAWLLANADRLPTDALQVDAIADAADTGTRYLGIALRELGWRKGWCRGARIWRAPAGWGRPPAPTREGDPDRRAGVRGDETGDRREPITDREAMREAARAERLVSDYTPLKPGDLEYAAGDLNQGKRDPSYDREKKQEFSKAMGTYRDELIAGEPSAASAVFVGTLAEQERRYQNKRQARIVSLTAANEALLVREFRAAAAEHLRGKIEPAGFALRGRPAEPASRSVVLFLSDLHLGADLRRAEESTAFGAVEEARRLEYLFHETCDYKVRYRDKSECVLILDGDIIQGLLLHDLRSGAPLTEQMIVCLRLVGAGIAMLAKRYPSVRVVVQPGNHGRNKLRHPGRATTSKWDGVEWFLGWCLREMARDLPNVTFQITMKAWSIVNLQGADALVTHGDTEIKLGPPTSKAEANYTQLVVASMLEIYGRRFAAAMFGHYHSAVAIPGDPYMLFNGMLIPADGHARSSGYISRPCGQWLFESVPGHVIGDLRFVGVGPAQDRDESLGKILVPYRLDMNGDGDV